MVNRYTRVTEQQALREARLYKWREDEVIAFIEHFKQEAPQMYADYLQQERNGSPDRCRSFVGHAPPGREMASGP